MSGDVRVVLDLGAAEPPYEQVSAQLAGLIGSGRLLPGDRLPTVRALAAILGLAVNPMARACKELEVAGPIDARRGRWCR